MCMSVCVYMCKCVCVCVCVCVCERQFFSLPLPQCPRLPTSHWTTGAHSFHQFLSDRLKHPVLLPTEMFPKVRMYVYTPLHTASLSQGIQYNYCTIRNAYVHTLAAILQWNLQIKDMLGLGILSFMERCALFGG